MYMYYGTYKYMYYYYREWNRKKIGVPLEFVLAIQK